MMGSTFARVLHAFFLLAAGAFAHAQPAPLRIGIAPHTSARVILELYQPLRTHLEKALNRPVEILTAPDFTEFARRALAQEYDLAVTTGHQARLFQTDGGYLPLLTYKAEFKAVAMVPNKSKVKAPRDLKGTTTIGLSASSLVTLWGQHWLAGLKLGPIPVRYVSAADSVAQLLLAGDGSAGFVSLANFQKLPPEVRSQLHILAESPAMAGRVYVLNQRNATQRPALEAALWTFAASASGKAYFEANKLEGYRKLRPRELQAMDPYAAEVRDNLKAK
jgi:phosphonate transport system substrate-binding protein